MRNGRWFCGEISPHRSSPTFTAVINPSPGHLKYSYAWPRHKITSGGAGLSLRALLL